LKADLIDAAVIAHFAEATKPKLRQMPDEVTRLLADLVARRRQIVEMIAAEAQRTRRMSDKRLTTCVARLRKALEKELSELDVLIDEQILGWECQQFCVRGRFDHHAAKKLSSKMMANWVFAATHSRGCIFHALAA
jgi:transposase